MTLSLVSFANEIESKEIDDRDAITVWLQIQYRAKVFYHCRLLLHYCMTRRLESWLREHLEGMPVAALFSSLYFHRFYMLQLVAWVPNFNGMRMLSYPAYH